MTEDERAIRALVSRWMEATRAGDLATVMSLMSEDMVFMVPGREPFGREEFRAASAGMKDMAFEGRSEIVELQICGDWAYIRNHIEITVTPPGGAAVRRAGYALSILRKESDGNWRLMRDANLVT